MRGRAEWLQKGLEELEQEPVGHGGAAVLPEGSGVITSQAAPRCCGGGRGLIFTTCTAPHPSKPSCPSSSTDSSLALSSENPLSREPVTPLNYTSAVFALDSCHPVIYPYMDFNCTLIFPTRHSFARICNSSTLGHFVYSLTKNS